MSGTVDAGLKAIPVLITLTTFLLTLSRGPGVLRSRLKHDVELVEKLPDSPARDVLLDFVHEQAKALTKYELEASRHWNLFVSSLFIAPSLGYFTVWLISEQSGWWTVPAAAVAGVATLLFVYGIFETGQRVPRDKDGKRLAPPATTATLPLPPDSGS